ncbi:MAG: hypothetical protein V4674_01795 [Patescibacteria group bacterium]
MANKIDAGNYKEYSRYSSIQDRQKISQYLFGNLEDQDAFRLAERVRNPETSNQASAEFQNLAPADKAKVYSFLTIDQQARVEKGAIENTTAGRYNTVQDAADKILPDVLQKVKQVIALVLSVVQTALTYWVYVAAQFFDWALYYCVVQFGEVANSPFVGEIWKLGRDVSNIFFIFILLYISISYVLDFRVAEAKKMIAWLIIVAVFINFSALFAKVVIDTPNVVSLLFYQKLVEAGNTAKKSGAASTVTLANQKTLGFSGIDSAAGVSGVFANALNIHSIYNFSSESAKDINGKEVDFANPGNTDFLIFMAGNIAFLAVTGFTFLAGGMMLFMRMITLTFVIMFAAIAFMAMLLPATRKLWDMWWAALFQNALFPAVYLFGLYVSAQMANVLPFINNNQKETLSMAFLGGSIGLVFQFILIIASMLGALILAKQTGAWGAETAEGFARRVNTLGVGFLAGAPFVASAALAEKGGQATARITGALGMPTFARGIEKVTGGAASAIRGGATAGTYGLNKLSSGINSATGTLGAQIGQKGINIYGGGAGKPTKEEQRKKGDEELEKFTDEIKKELKGESNPVALKDMFDELEKNDKKKFLLDLGWSDFKKNPTLLELLSNSTLLRFALNDKTKGYKYEMKKMIAAQVAAGTASAKVVAFNTEITTGRGLLAKAYK